MSIDGSLHRVNQSITVATSLATPGCRMVLIEAYADREPGGSYSSEHFVLPVIVIRSTIVDRYFKMATLHDWPDESQNHADMLRRGLEFVEREAREEPLVWTEDMGFETPDERNQCVNGVVNLVVCHWPVGDDHLNLAPIIEKTMRAAEAKTRRYHGEHPDTIAAKAVQA